MAEKKKMSVAEILAAARRADGGAPGAETAAAPNKPAPAAKPVAEANAAAEEPAEAKPAAAAKKPAAAKAAGGGRPSVADILAAARANKAAGGGEEPKQPAAAKPAGDKPKPAAAAKPAAKPAAAAAAAKTGVKRDTASVLAAARGGAKPGPVSKADAPPAVAARLQAAAARPKGEAAIETAKPAAKPAEKPAAARAAPAMPAKPAKPAKAAAKGGEEDRRGFLEIALGSFMAVGFSALSVTGGLFTLGLARFMFPNVLAEPPSRFKVGFKEAFPSGKVETKFVPQYGVWVVNSDVQGQQQIYALKTVCTHLGCTPNWLEAEQKFKCPCHGSGFYKDGVNFEGPAPRPLERYAIRIGDDGQLEIDKSRTFQEEMGQWADPDSFVTA
jgi:cytochrome b6-f complex iron-sulfur subunit